MKILPPPHNKGQQTATGSGEIISSTGGLIQSVNILPETGKPAELHKVPGSVVTSSVRILPLSAPATSAADAGNTVALISAEGPPKPLVSSQAATFTTRSAHQPDFIRLAFCERSLIFGETLSFLKNSLSFSENSLSFSENSLRLFKRMEFFSKIP